MSSIGGVQTTRISALTDTSVSATDAAQIAELTQANLLVGMIQANAATKAELQVGLEDTTILVDRIHGLDPNAAAGTAVTRSAEEAQDLAAFVMAHPAVWRPGDGGIVFKDAQGQQVTDLAGGGVVSAEVAPPGAKTFGQVQFDGMLALQNQVQDLFEQMHLVDERDAKMKQIMGQVGGDTQTGQTKTTSMDQIAGNLR